MAVESSKETGENQVEALIDDLIREIFSEAGATDDPAARGMSSTAALFETAFGSARGASRMSSLERALFAEALASELADSLAGALAEHLAPRIMKALEQQVAIGEETGKKPAPAARSGSQAKKPEAK